MNGFNRTLLNRQINDYIASFKKHSDEEYKQTYQSIIDNFFSKGKLNDMTFQKRKLTQNGPDIVRSAKKIFASFFIVRKTSFR